jgi:hypothetical protein
VEGKAVTGLGEMMTGSQGCRLRSRARVRREGALREVQGQSVSLVAYARRPGAVRASRVECRREVVANICILFRIACGRSPSLCAPSRAPPSWRGLLRTTRRRSSGLGAKARRGGDMFQSAREICGKCAGQRFWMREPGASQRDACAFGSRGCCARYKGQVLVFVSVMVASSRTRGSSSSSSATSKIAERARGRAGGGGGGQQGSIVERQPSTLLERGRSGGILGRQVAQGARELSSELCV